MKIIDQDRLLPNEEVLRDVISRHPLDQNLACHLDTVEVFLSERCEIAYERIFPDVEHRSAKLGLGRSSKDKINFEYILYHEFSHFADRTNPEFEYSDQLRESLSDLEQMAVMALWNLFIDARLNCAGLFALGEEPESYSTNHGWIPNTVQGKLQDHAIKLENIGVPYEKAMEVVSDCWNNPPAGWTYKKMIEWVRYNSGEPVVSPDGFATR